MGVPLLVSPHEPRKLYNVATVQAGEAIPRVGFRIDHERRRAILMVRQQAIRGPRLSYTAHLAGTREPVGQVDHRDGLFGGVYGPRIGDAPISPGASVNLALGESLGGRIVPLEAIDC
jgi:hypothetical protein